MPDSKLVEKLGFEIAGHCIIRNYPDGTQSSVSAGEETVALWNLCLELSERLAGIRIKTLKETAKLACDYCRIDGEPTDKSHGTVRVSDGSTILMMALLSVKRRQFGI